MQTSPHERISSRCRVCRGQSIALRNLAMDAIDLTLDDGWLDPLQAPGETWGAS